MSTTYIVDVVCDKCGRTTVNSTGSYCVNDWIKINIEVYNYPQGSVKRDELRGDYCSECVNKYGVTTLTDFLARSE